jgi:ADP-ribose pyrophosphatase YjhB (NUDIX family)
MPETHLFVGAVVRFEGRILFVRQSPGHPLEGQWTVPWGRVQPGESPAAAAVRETQEEGGVEAVVEGLLGVQELPSPQQGCIGLAYLCRHIGGTPVPRDRETDAAAYYSAIELEVLSEPLEPWSHWLAQRIFAGRYTVTHADSSNPLRSSGSFL